MKIHIEFCEKWNYHPDFDRVSKEIIKIKPNAEVKGNTQTPRNGAFEVTINGKLVYSKLQTGQFPQAKDISSWFWSRQKGIYNRSRKVSSVAQ